MDWQIIISMIFILSITWGGLLYFLNIAYKREKEFKANEIEIVSKE